MAKLTRAVVLGLASAEVSAYNETHPEQKGTAQMHSVARYNAKLGPLVQRPYLLAVLLLSACTDCRQAPTVSDVRPAEVSSVPDLQEEHQPSTAVKTHGDGPAWRPGYQRPLVIDVHGHINPSGLVHLSKVMTDNGLSLMVNLSGGSHQRGLEIAVKMQSYFENIRHAYTPDWRQLERPDFGLREAQKLEDAVTKHGFVGLKISKALGLYLTHRDGDRVAIDWKGLDPLWEKAGDLGVPVSIHTADPEAFWEPTTPENERYAELKVHPNWSFADPSKFPPRGQLHEERNRVIARHPNTTFICVHFANNPENLEIVDKWLDQYPNMMMDTSARLAELGRHPAALMRAFFIKHKTRILFGTDLGLSRRSIMLGSMGEKPPSLEDIKPFYQDHWRYFEGTESQIPHPVPIQGNWKVDAINLPDDVLAHLYHRNAERVFDLSKPHAPVPGHPTLP